MVIAYVFLTLLLLFGIRLWSRIQMGRKLNHLPGPRGHILHGSAFQMNDPKIFHKYLAKLKAKFGPVYKFRFGPIAMSVVADYDSIHEVMITKGKETGGRYGLFRIRHTLQDTGILFSRDPDVTWKTLRKVSQRHFKQFGEGMTRLQNLITDIAEDMFDTFAAHEGSPLDPKKAIFDTALKNIAFLIDGQRYYTGDELLENMKEYEPLFMKYVVSVAPVEHTLIDSDPWLRYFGIKAWKKICRLIDLEQIIWKGVVKSIAQNSCNEGLAQLLLEYTKEGGAGPKETQLTEKDARRTCLSLLLAGIATTSSSFYSLLNIFAHDQKVQEKVTQEINKASPSGRPITLNDRAQMPYTRAVVLELLRYFTVVPMGVGHRTLCDVTIQGHRIPKETLILTDLWGLHHDDTLWGDSAKFRPERFLDDQGELVPADHPNRKHLVPFGMGPRVCLGESLALARLFLWTATTVQRFRITPAEDNDPSLAHVDSYYQEGVMYSPPFNVIFEKR